MLDQDAVVNPVDLYRSATRRAVVVAEGVRPDQLGLPTPCTEWDVQALLDHLVGGTEYLLAAMDGREPVPSTGTTAADYRDGVEAVMKGLGEAGATVYATGRSSRTAPRPTAPPGPDILPDPTHGTAFILSRRPETIEETASLVEIRGGRGIPVRVDHTVEAEVEALFARVRREQGRLDILVNDVWGGDELTE